MAKSPTLKKDPAQADLIEKIEITAPSDKIEVKKDDEPLVVAGEDDPGEVEEEAHVVLERQIAALKKSEELQKGRAEQAARDRDAALARVRESDTQVGKVQKEALQSQAESIDIALGAAQAESESAKRDIKTAINNGDADAQADAYERLATARANISKLQDGKIEIESRLKAQPEKPVSMDSQDSLDKTNLPDSAKSWLRSNPAYLTDQRKNAKIQSLHWDVMDEGHAAFSPAYFESLEVKLGMREAPVSDEVVVQPKPQQRAPIVSAPVSREAPSTPNQPRGAVRLSAAQREAAKNAGITEAEYAKQLLRLNEMRANGSYGDQQ